MGTSADIGRLKADGTFNAFHISYDGYLSGAGAKLFKHYRTPEAIDALFSKTGAASLEADPSKMRDNKWFDGTETFALEDFSFLYRDGAWWYHEAQYAMQPMEVQIDAEIVIRDMSVMVGSNWVEITREMLIADDPMVEEYLVSTEYEPSVEERIDAIFQAAAEANTNPNVKYFKGHGAWGVSATFE